MVAEEVIITLSGGAPWGFRLQGGFEHHKPLQVAKVRKRSKACRAGLREGDELVSINENSCGSLSHAQAMNLIDSMPGTLHIRVKRAPDGFQSVVLVARAPSPRIDKEYRAALRALSPSKPHQTSVRQIHHTSLTSPGGRSGLTSPPGSEAYYGETDSDADVAANERHRKPKRRSPSNLPGKAGRSSPEGAETSEMSGYDSASDAQVYHPSGPNEKGDPLPGVARKEVIYQPAFTGVWSTQTSTETSSMSADDQNPQEGLMEEDSGFQEITNVPLVSPERAKEARMLSSCAQFVPMVGPVDNPVDEELTLTYMDKAKQAKLNRGDTLMDKQVKEARSKCRTIASLLTDAPNPHSKGVLMFKKRRQRSKKYTLTSFGSVDENIQQDSQEEDGMFPGSESEFDEEGFSAAPDPTWDSDYLEMLEKRSASRGMEGESGGALSPGLSDTSGKGAQLFEQQRRRAVEHAKKMEAVQEHLQSQMRALPEVKTTPIQPHPDSVTKPSLQPPPVPVKPARHSKTLHPEVSPAETAINQETHQATTNVFANINDDTSHTIAPAPSVLHVTNFSVTSPEAVMPPPPAPLPELPASSVLNRTARPFAPGCITHRAATAPVVFRPTVSKKTPRPVSVAVVASPFSTTSEESTMGVTSAATHLTVSQRSPNVPVEIPTQPFVPDKPIPPPTVYVESYSQPPQHFSSVENIQVASVPPPKVPTEPTYSVDTQTVSSGHEDATVAPVISQARVIPSQTSSTVIHSDHVTPSNAVKPLSPVGYHDKTLGTGPRTGILIEARRRSSNKPMFKMPENKEKGPNPELLSLVQNLDEGPRHGYYEPENVPQNIDENRTRVPPPVAPKPRIIPDMSQIPQAEGKGAELFARRQIHKDLFVVDTPPLQQPLQQPLQHQQFHSVTNLIQPHDPSSASSQWKYSPNIRAPPPIGYNPLLSPSCPVGVQRGGTKVSGESSKVSKVKYGTRKEGIQAIDFMRRQPYQLNSAMFSSGTGISPQSSTQKQQREGHTLTQPRQIPVKTTRVYEIKRFSTPTPMSAPTLCPTVIVPRSQTTLGERLSHSDMSSPPPLFLPEPTSAPSRATGLPELPKFSAAPVSHPVPYLPTAPVSSMSSLNYPGLQAAKQFKSAPELSFLRANPLKSPVQAPKPRFIAARAGIQPHIWRPGTLPH